MKSLRDVAICVTLLIGLVTAAVCSSDWDLRRQQNGTCAVQPSGTLPQFGDLLKRHPSRKAACEDAKSRRTDDDQDKDKCFVYTTATKAECKKEGVDLKD